MTRHRCAQSMLQIPRTAVAVLLLHLLMAGPFASWSRAEAATVEAAAKELFSDPDIQFELPGWDPGSGDTGASRWSWQRNWSTTGEEGSRWAERLRSAAELAQPLLWMLAAAGAALVIFWIAQAMPGLALGRRRVPVAGDEPGSTRGAGDREPDPLQAADRLADRGAFAEALHRLLVGALAIVQARSAESLAVSLTSREVLRVAGLPEAAHGPLRILIGVVERTHFGERSASAEEYRACRQRFVELSQALTAHRLPAQAG
jgi:hypothetical protein